MSEFLRIRISRPWPARSIVMPKHPRIKKDEIWFAGIKLAQRLGK